MSHRLQRHPDTPCEAIDSIEAEAATTESGQLVLRFVAKGAISSLKLPEPVRYGSRSDNLWQTTCFEAFVTSGGGAYLELNLSPSTAWAAYTFTSYRKEPGLPVIDAPPIDVDRSEDELVVTGAIDLSNVAILHSESLRIGLAAVIEETNGRKSYWALAHPPGKPDFHDPACFVLELPAPDPA